MKILFDTNVVLDALLARSPFDIPATRLLDAVERRHIGGFLAATTVTTIHYIAARAHGAPFALKEITRLLMLFDIAPITHPILTSALSLSFRDYEDAVLHEAARLADLDGIVTRNGADFQQSTLPVYTPEEFLVLLKVQ